jgi:hypothetical protein
LKNFDVSTRTLFIHFFHRSDDLRVESEDELLETLIDLGPDYEELWNYIEIQFLSDSGFSCFVSKLPFCSLSSDIWSRIVSIFSSSENKQLNCCRFETPPRWVGFVSVSQIVSTFPSVLRELRDENWDLLYRGSRDGFTSSSFHAKCDTISNTVTLILTSE